MNGERRRRTRELIETIDRLPAEAARMVLGRRAAPGEALRLGKETRAVLVAEPDGGRRAATVEVCLPPELARRIRGAA